MIEAYRASRPRARRHRAALSHARALARAGAGDDDRRSQHAAAGLCGAWARRQRRCESWPRQILAAQRPDGGWAQNAILSSDAYATGQSLFALAEAGGLKPGDRRLSSAGSKYLLSTQRPDGSWYVRSRAPKFQPFFDERLSVRPRPVDLVDGHRVGDGSVGDGAALIVARRKSKV